ncbi:hypothetical protein E0W68_06985 [Flavobacterium salilacus subsp. salilacus]|uniref:hypothetical protein n=1 Tax=Flavobacterium TaxID=237 RepID=UPI00107586B3|nr:MULTISPECIES: hypothetical protein [Flavobacterium]KAF2518996.1 hypothetical protein E0W68_06985 [Flavobacterium salilacus subsp. salilacus]MBE1614841.1 hypothetical protein [Flavobacterium sp. SaA2.13]
MEAIRVGVCKHTGKKVLQIKDNDSDNAIDEKGWLCLHEDSEEEEISSIIKHIYLIDLPIESN